jgi:hypothetical protein
MKIKISYVEPKEVVMDMTPEEYCHYRAKLSSLYPFPTGSYNHDIEIMDEESEIELDEYFLIKKLDNLSNV